MAHDTDAAASSDSARLIVTKEGKVGSIVFDNLKRHNALTPEMVAALPGALKSFADDDTIRVVILRGAGTRAFIAGGDLGRVQKWDEGADPSDPPENGLEAIPNFPKPVIVLIHGWCLGAGLALALQADIRIAADDSQFAIPAAKWGIGYPHNMTSRLVQLVGPAHASEMLFTGERFAAAEALRLGIVNRVVPKEELEATVAALATAIANNAPLSIRAEKAGVRAALSNGDRRDIEECERLVDLCGKSEDLVEGLKAFAEKRTPHFIGR